MYSRTLRENIALAHPDAPQEEIDRAARDSSLSHVIESFPDGYDTQIGERGVTLSGGQKQRVAIARTLLRNTPVLILDDSLSAVDTKTDAQIRNALETRRGDRTTFLISHRISTLSHADIILVLEDGRLVQRGTAEELLKVPGLYRDLYEIQSARKKQEELL